MSDKSDSLLKAIFLVLAGFFGVVVLFVVFISIVVSSTKSEDMARRETDPVYKAQAEQKDADAEIQRLEQKSLEESQEMDRKRLIVEKEADEANQKAFKKLQEAAYKERVNRDAEKMLAMEKYMKDVAEAADKKR